MLAADAVPAAASAEAPTAAYPRVRPNPHFTKRNKRFDDLFEASCYNTTDSFDVKMTKNLEYWRDLADQASQKANRALTAILAAAKAGRVPAELTLAFADSVAEEQYAAFHFIRTWTSWKGILQNEEERTAEWSEVFGDYLYLAEAWYAAKNASSLDPPPCRSTCPSKALVTAEYMNLLRLAAADASAEELQTAKFSVQKAVEEHTAAVMHYVCSWVQDAWPRFARRDASGAVIAMTAREYRLEYILENLDGNCEFGHLAMVLLASSFP
jgi:hypothetical protein